MGIEDLCEQCGGSGSDTPWYGPFLVVVPEHLRDEAHARLRRRAEILKRADRALGGQFFKLLGKRVDEEDLLHVVSITLARAVKTWTDGNAAEAFPDLFEVITHILWLLEGWPND